MPRFECGNRNNREILKHPMSDLKTLNLTCSPELGATTIIDELKLLLMKSTLCVFSLVTMQSRKMMKTRHIKIFIIIFPEDKTLRTKNLWGLNKFRWAHR